MAQVATVVQVEVVPAGRPEEAAVADATVDEVVAGIRAIQSKHGFALAKEVGRLVVERFFGGDTRLLRQRGPKDPSLRKLARHPDLPMSATSLHYALGVFEVLDRRPDVHSSEHLTPTHVRTVLALPPPDQDRLLRKAEDKALTVEQLAAEARKVRAKRMRGGGRPALPRFVKTIHALRRYAEDSDELFGDLDGVETLDAEEAQALYRTVTGLKLRCESLQQRLQSRVTGFGRSE